jgi:endo-alpha-1,4-polygalactosaminidase (GH114 family)
MKPKDIVVEILKKLQDEGLDGLYAWFVGGWPHVVMRERHDGGYEVLMWREGVKLLVKLNKELKVVDAAVYYE